MPDFFEIGRIVNTHGVKGELRVVPSTFDIERFKLLDEIALRGVKGTDRVKIERVWFHKRFVILKIEGVDSIDEGSRLKGGVLIIPREAALPLGKDEYYLADLYGIEVDTADGEHLGRIYDVIQTGANDVYAVRCPKGAEILIPAIKQCVLNVDINEKRMTVKLPDGLR